MTSPIRGAINVDLPGARISRHLYGQFAEHLGRCIYDGFYVGESSEIPNEGGIRLDVVDALRAINIPNLRWPGGCFADEYHWKDGIGPRESRPSIVNSNWGDVVEDNSFGTHEFMALCELLGAEAYVSANVGSGTVRESSEWVEYLTRSDDSPMARVRRANGRDEPWKVPFWGLGNEPWGGGGSMGPDAYAQLARTHALYSRNHNGNELYRIAAGANGADYRWTEVLMRALGRRLGGVIEHEGDNIYQGISFHYYTIIGPWEHKGSATDFTEHEYYKTIAEASRIETILSGHAAVMDAYDPDKRVGLVLDEWGTWFDVEPGTNPGFLFQQNALRDALVAAIHFDSFHRHADRLSVANIAQAVNVLQAMILTDGEVLVLTPTYHVFEMNKGHHDALALEVGLITPLPKRSIDGAEISMISLSASRSETEVLVSMSNLDAERNYTINLEFRGEKLGPPSARILSAPKVDAHNTAADREAVAPAAFDGVTFAQGALSVTIPAHSFVTISLPRVHPE